jgi:hypothetical protein
MPLEEKLVPAGKEEEVLKRPSARAVIQFDVSFKRRI